ncbi:MAG: T9SS C-terminal target domain-containing protein, partial [Bacteroidota bacterium]
MSLKTYYFLLTLLLPCFSLYAQNQVIVNDADLVGGSTYTWTADNEYLLNGIVVLETGGVLTIEPGTIIRGRASFSINSGDNASALIIARGAQLFAEGTPSQPIVFTAEEDDVLDPTDFTPEDVGEWGGLALLGAAPISRPGGQAGLEGFNAADLRFSFGGDAPADNSGSLRYVSIRHVGAQASVDNEMNGLTLAGVGNGTLIDQVETFACLDDGFEFLGGTVNAYHLIATYCQDDAFDVDLGYRGIGQFWLGVASRGHLAEIDGANPDNQPPFALPDLANLTLVGTNPSSDVQREGESLYFRDNTGGRIRNSVFVNARTAAVVIEDRDDTETEDAFARFQAGDLSLTNNYFSNENGETNWSEVAFLWDQAETVSPTPQTALTDVLAANNELTATPVIENSATNDFATFSPLPRAGSSILTGGTPITEPGFVSVPYQGAFGENDNWFRWSATTVDTDFFQIVSGQVTQAAENCTPLPGDVPAAGVIVRLETDGTFRY